MIAVGAVSEHSFPVVGPRAGLSVTQYVGQRAFLQQCQRAPLRQQAALGNWFSLKLLA